MSINKSSIQAVLDTDLEKLLVQTNQVVTGDRYCFKNQTIWIKSEAF